MPHLQRAAHLITHEEAELIDCFRLLHSECRATIIAVVASCINVEKSPTMAAIKLRIVDPPANS